MNGSLPHSKSRIVNALDRFLFTPASPAPLAALRIGVASVLLLQALALAGNLMELYGSRGMVQPMITDTTVHPLVPRASWVVNFLGGQGISEETALRGLFAVYVGSLACLAMGYGTRVASVLSWMTHLMLKANATASVYGVDSFAQIMLFYLMFMPAGGAWSVDRLFGRTSGEPSSGARLALRVLQIHLCIVYFASGIEKSLGADWWNGEAIWCSLMRSDLCPYDMSWLASYSWVAILAGWSTLFIEIGYPFFIWPKASRKIGAMATIGMHVGIAVMMGLTSFAALMSVLTFSAFLVSSEPKTEAAEATEAAPAKLLAA